MRNRFFQNFEKCEPQRRLLLTVDDDGAADDAGGDTGGEPPPAKPKGVVTMPQEALTERLDRARKSGLSDAMKLLGVKDASELQALAERLKAKDEEPEPEDKPAKKPAQGASDEELKRLRQAAKDADKRAKDAEDRQRDALESLETERRLERAALRAGISDTEYALTLVKRHVSGLDEKQAAKFDASKYFADLAKSKPHLCEPDEKPADTGTGGNGADDEPNPEKGAGKNGAPTQKKPALGASAFNAMKGTKAEMAARLQQLRSGGK